MSDYGINYPTSNARSTGQKLSMCLGIPGKVTAIYREHELLMGKIDFGGVFKQVCLEHVPAVTVGDYVLVHVGFALAKIDETEARHVFAFLEGMNELEELRASPSGGQSAQSGPALDVIPGIAASERRRVP
jgi:hydrogenase expression/formation protein HypC